MRGIEQIDQRDDEHHQRQHMVENGGGQLLVAR